MNARFTKVQVAARLSVSRITGTSLVAEPRCAAARLSRNMPCYACLWLSKNIKFNRRY